MTKENKQTLVLIALGTVVIGGFLSLIILFIFGHRTAYFFVVVFAIPMGVVFSLVLMILYRAIKPDK